MKKKTTLSRRELLKRVGIVGAAAASAQPRLLLATPATAPPLEALPVAQAGVLPGDALENFTAAEAATIEAMVARLIPSDENGPGAAEARAARYIDRALGGALASSREAYRSGLSAVDSYARLSKGASFAQLSPTDQDRVLSDMETNVATGFVPGASTFFNLVRTHTIQGTFCDPYYGGNANFVGWDLIGYPGLRLAVSANDQRLDPNLTPIHKSAYDDPMFSKKRPARASLEREGHPSTSSGRAMAINLKKTDVAIVGLGAVGGVAALPLARAGLEVVGLEAGTWLTPADFAPDELRNNVRGWPQAVQKANREVPTHRPNASAPYSPRPTIHPMMNAVGGTSLHYWAQSWRLNPWDFKVVSETTRRYGASRIPRDPPWRTGPSRPR